MKKLLGIVVLGLLLSGNVSAKQLKTEQSKWLIPIAKQHKAWILGKKTLSSKIKDYNKGS